MKHARKNRSTDVGEVATAVGERVAAFLRRRHPAKTAVSVSADTGLSEHTIARMLERESAPSAGAFLALIAAYGPGFFVECFPDPPGWLSAAAHQARVDEAEARLARAQADLASARQAVLA